MMIFF